VPILSTTTTKALAARGLRTRPHGPSGVLLDVYCAKTGRVRLTASTAVIRLWPDGHTPRCARAIVGRGASYTCA